MTRPARTTHAGTAARRRRAAALALALGTLALAPGARAADEPAAPKPGQACDAPARRQFDFWLGDWDVRDPAGKIVGHNRITRVHGGCALEEQWSGNGGVTGSSLNTWDNDRKRWHQTWVDNTGGLLQLDGTWQDGRMVLTGADASAPAAQPAEQRVTWQPLPDGRVRQLWEASKDAGRTWTTVFDGLYARKAAAPAGG